MRHTHRVELGDKLVVKHYRHWDAGEPEREWQALTLLDRWSPGLAPCPLERGEHDGHPYLVMTRVPGEPLGQVNLSTLQVAAVGTALQQLHRAVPEQVLAGVPQRAWGPAAMLTRVRSWIDKPDGPVPTTAQGTLAMAREWVFAPASDVLAQPGPRPVFTHADGNIANLLWDGSRCRVVDFEDAGVSDRAYEVADILEHVSVWLASGVRAETLGPALGLADDERDRLASCRVLFAVFWLLMLLPGGPAAGRNPEGTLERQVERLATLLARVPE